jgi:hypothetical protein
MNETFRVFSCDVFDKSRKEAITVLGDRAQQTRPITLTRQFDRGPRVAWFPRATRLNLDGFLRLIDTNYRGVQPPSLF